MTEKPIMNNKYEDWWANTGSAIRPYVDDDFDSHAKRVSERAWRACENQSEFADRLFMAMKEDAGEASMIML